jgi:hypothetical protein
MDLNYCVNFLPLIHLLQNNLKVKKLGLKLKVDGKEIPLNEFVEKIMIGTVTGAVTSLRGIKEDWKKIEIEIEK